MKTASKVLIALGILSIVIGQLTFRNLNYVNAVDAHAWTININGIYSFPWPAFIGGVFIVVGIICYFSGIVHRGRRFQ